MCVCTSCDTHTHTLNGLLEFRRRAVDPVNRSSEVDRKGSIEKTSVVSETSFLSSSRYTGICPLQIPGYWPLAYSCECVCVCMSYIIRRNACTIYYDLRARARVSVCERESGTIHIYGTYCRRRTLLLAPAELTHFRYAN